MKMEARKAGLPDIPLIHRLAGIVFYDTYKDILSCEQLDYMYDMMYSSESLLRQMEEEHHIYFIAYHEGEPCGYVSIERQGDSLFHLQKIYVMPASQGKGAGRFLMERAFAYIKEIMKGRLCTVELNVNRENKARFFYEKLGYRIVRSGDFPIGGGFYMNDYVMAIEL